MQKSAYKISAILLCGLLIYNSLGYFLVLSVMKVAIQHQKWAQISTFPDKHLTYFVFVKSKENSRLKILNDREIIVDGKMYDIVRKVFDSRYIKYVCIHDNEEESLIAQTRIINSNNQPIPVQNTTRFIVEKIIKTGIVTEKPFHAKEITLSSALFCSEAFYKGPAIQISSPPPQQFS